MPFIDVKVSCELDTVQEQALKAGLGKAIALIPTKEEATLMVQFTDNCRLWFAGKQDGTLAMVNVMVYGSAPREGYERFSQAAVELFEKELGVKKIYVKFEEVPNWFGN